MHERLARILGHRACWFAATLLGLTPDQRVEASLQKHLFYELTNDRKNFWELLNATLHPLTRRVCDESG